MSQPLVSFNNNDTVLKLDEYGYWSFKWSLGWAGDTISKDFHHNAIKNSWPPTQMVLQQPGSAQLYLAYYNTAAYLYYVHSILNLDKVYYPIIEIGLKVGIKSCLETIPNFEFKEDDIAFALNTIDTFEAAMNYDLKKLSETDANVFIPNFDYAASRLIRLIEMSYGFPQKDIPILVSDKECMQLGYFLQERPVSLLKTLKIEQACILVN